MASILSHQRSLRTARSHRAMPSSAGALAQLIAAPRPPARSPARWRARRTERAHRAAAASGSEPDGEGLDIDALAARLAAEAERLRRMGGDKLGAKEDAGEAEADDADAPPASNSGRSPAREELAAPFGYESKAAEAGILAAVGDGGFSAQEFELQQELGTINIQQAGGGLVVVEAVVLDLNAGPPEQRAEARKARPAVIAFSAVYYSGMPFQDPVLVLAKARGRAGIQWRATLSRHVPHSPVLRWGLGPQEYLPGAKAVGCNELQVLSHLASMPGPSSKWEAASALLEPHPPVVPLLGYFIAGQSQRAEQIISSEGSPSSGGSSEDALWIVLKWEGLAPLSLYASAQQTSGLGLGRLFGGQAAAVHDRAIARGALEALAFCHERGVVHGALGSGSLMLSTFDDRAHTRLVVKLDNFGFSRLIKLPSPGAAGSSAAAGGTAAAGGGGARQPRALFPAPGPAAPDDTPLALGRREDLRALGVVLLECLLSALARGGPSQLTSAESIQRLLGDVFHYSLPDFEAYCRDEPDWEEAVALLDDAGRAGWELLAALLGGRAGAGELAAGAAFCQAG
eukprot:scaffold22.g6053.t1